MEDEEDEEEAYWLSDCLLVNEVSRPVSSETGPCSRCMSPKYFSVSFSASSWFTPAKATTMRSGRKKVFLYLFTTLLLINCKRS